MSVSSGRNLRRQQRAALVDVFSSQPHILLITTTVTANTNSHGSKSLRRICRKVETALNRKNPECRSSQRGSEIYSTGDQGRCLGSSRSPHRINCRSRKLPGWQRKQQLLQVTLRSLRRALGHNDPTFGAMFSLMLKAPNANQGEIFQATDSDTSMLPRVAFEYGHT